MSRLRRRPEDLFVPGDATDPRTDFLLVQVAEALDERPELVSVVGMGWRHGGSRLRMAALQLGIPIHLRK